MNKLFIADRDFSREIPRTMAHGYKSVVIAEDVNIGVPFEFQTVDNEASADLAAVAVEPVENAGECYTILCREFGLVNGSKGDRSKVSVIFCDNGWMLVTLYHGCLVMNLGDQLLMPMVGDDVQQPQVVNDQILWVNADKLLGYKAYIGDRGYFMYDYEFMLVLGGDNLRGMGNFMFKHLEDEDIDISYGYIAQHEQNKVKRAQAWETKRMMAAVFGGGSSSGPMEFDESGHYPEEEDEDDSGVEW